ncbi:RNA polymerase II degradation factor 1 [Iris pallida]|uniref:RNA polymerase II degradation factor 1 n=1 Tax=Iris pallida TaxID=29817 RepID=A0AAX6G0J1_IRIPA|nr:RNA polymerase II degradation factor 1 [Iris pallida]
MATTPKAREGSNLKERKNSAPSSLQSTLSSERRSPRPITPDNHKQALNNVKLKSTVAPVIAPKFTSSIKRLPLQKPTEKSPTRTPKSHTTPPSSPMIKEGPVRLPYAAPKQFTSLKPSWEKVPKLASSAAKTGQVTRARVVDSRREAIVPTADKTKILDPRRGATVPATSTSSSSAIDSSAITVNKEALATSTSSAVDSSAITVNREALATLEEKVQKEDIIESLGIRRIHTSKVEIEQDPVDSTPVEEHLVEYPQFQLNSNAEETTDDYSMQTEEKKAEANNDRPTKVEEEKGEETSTDSRVEEGGKVDDAKIETKSTRRGQRLPAVEPLTEEAKPTKIRAAMDASKRNAEAVKKETVRSNDVIEEAKSKFLEKRKNKVLALVGAFETVMALQEPEGQQAKAKEAESSIE